MTDQNNKLNQRNISRHKDTYTGRASIRLSKYWHFKDIKLVFFLFYKY